MDSLVFWNASGIDRFFCFFFLNWLAVESDPFIFDFFWNDLIMISYILWYIYLYHFSVKDFNVLFICFPSWLPMNIFLSYISLLFLSLGFGVVWIFFPRNHRTFSLLYHDSKRDLCDIYIFLKIFNINDWWLVYYMASHAWNWHWTHRLCRVLSHPFYRPNRTK